jgi:hypothetical protein
LPAVTSQSLPLLFALAVRNASWIDLFVEERVDLVSLFCRDGCIREGVIEVLREIDPIFRVLPVIPRLLRKRNPG